jgi:GntR family transcriptional regulator/MocR family aminotransferase
MLVPLTNDGPLHLQIYRAFREAILTGRFSPGERLPSSRSEARLLGISRNVVLQAYDQLTAEGYLAGTIGSGTYVARDLPEDPLPSSRGRTPVSQYGRRAVEKRARRTKDLRFDFVYGLSSPDETTIRQWQRCLRKASERIAFDYGPTEGEPALREAIASYLFRNRGVRSTPEQILIVNGSQQALSLASRVLFDTGDPVVIEDPCYQGARQIFAADGVRLLPHAVDLDGLDPSQLGAARGVYVTPSHQFPTGATMPVARRLKLLAWAEAHDAVILEDDYDSGYRYDGRPLEAIQSLDDHGRVVYIGTFSKVLFPAIRIGFLSLPHALVPAFTRAKWLADRHTPSLEQLALAELMASGELEQHLRRARARNAARRKTLLAAIERELGDAVEVSGANAGIHVLVWLRKGPGAETVIRNAEARGVGLYSAAPYFYAGPTREGFLFGYGTLTETDIEEGIRHFAKALRE